MGGRAGVNNWFPDCKSNTFWYIVMKLHTLAPHESRMCPRILGSKDQRSRSWIIDVWKWFPDHNWLCNPTYDHETSYTCSPWVKDVPYWFWGQKVKGQSHGLSMFENGFRTITDYVIHLWSWNFIHLLPMSQGCALLILGSKGQRSRSWIIDVWKWFPDHNWLCNPYKFFCIIFK